MFMARNQGHACAFDHEKFFATLCHIMASMFIIIIMLSGEGDIKSSLPHYSKGKSMAKLFLENLAAVDKTPEKCRSPSYNRCIFRIRRLKEFPREDSMAEG